MLGSGGVISVSPSKHLSESLSSKSEENISQKLKRQILMRENKAGYTSKSYLYIPPHDQRDKAGCEEQNEELFKKMIKESKDESDSDSSLDSQQLYDDTLED